MISSVSVYSSYKLTAIMVAEGKLSDPSNSFYLERTIAHVFIGIFMLVIFSKTPYSIFERYIRILFF